MERETGFEPATSTLARSHSTTELFPLISEAPKIAYHADPVPSSIGGFAHAGQRTVNASTTASTVASVARRARPRRHRSNTRRWTDDFAPRSRSSHAYHLPIPRSSDRFQWGAEGLRQAGLHFHEHKDLPIAGDDVVFAMTSPLTAGKNRIARRRSSPHAYSSPDSPSAA